jgi:hypothetical protein
MIEKRDTQRSFSQEQRESKSGVIMQSEAEFPEAKRERHMTEMRTSFSEVDVMWD